MGYKERKQIYSRIEKIRKRPLLVYVTSLKQGIRIMMAQDVIAEIIRHINLIESDNKGIDVLIISTGGDPIVSLRINKMLRDRYKKIGVMIPYIAYSAATLLAIGAEEIIMHPYANLGPVDPQLTVAKQNQPPMQFAYEDIKKYVEFVKDIGISDQELMQKSFELLTKEVGTVPIGAAKRSSQLALSMSEKLLCTHMEDKANAKLISETLNNAFYHHGYPLFRDEAKEIGLPISDGNEEIEKHIWEICEDFSEEMRFNEVFDPQKILVENMAKGISKIPINVPQNLQSKIKIAAVESSVGESFIEQVANINYVIAPNLSTTQNITMYTSAWMNKMNGGDDNGK